MQQRLQRTIRRDVKACGIGFLTGADVSIRLLPAGPNHGIAFQRTDCPGSEPIPALVEFTVPRQRRTAIEHQGVVVEMVEHVLAALSGLHVDNCLVQLNAPEPPGLDGSSRELVERLLEAGSVEQDEPRPLLIVKHAVRAASADGRSELVAQPISHAALPVVAGSPDPATSSDRRSPNEAGCTLETETSGWQSGPVGRPDHNELRPACNSVIDFRLEHGTNSPIPPQKLSIAITPETFTAELAFARTFVLQAEAEVLRAQGYGRRTTAKDLLVFGPDGPIDNQLRAADECVRHKILDFIGDLALIGCDVCGHFIADRSGHQLNREIVRKLKAENQKLKAAA